MSRYRDQVAAALGAVTIRGPTQYAWLGHASLPLAAYLAAELDEPGRRRYLVSCLREELYWSFYCHGRPVPARWGEPEPMSADPSLAAALSQANAGRGGWEPGWTIEHLDDDEAVVAAWRLRMRVPLDDCRALGGAMLPGTAVSVRMPKELPALSPGFFTVIGEAAADLAASEGSVRVYWNIARAGAPALVGTLTSRLNAECVPFRLKVADHPFRLDRCDAAILYLPGDAFRALGRMLRAVAADLAAQLRPQIPAFTLELAPGVALAEDDGGGGESFGVRRCTLLADGIVRAHAQGIMGAGARLDAVAARFAEDGVRIDAPYLEPSLAGRHVL
jgi:class II lanthipeptide synthase